MKKYLLITIICVHMGAVYAQNNQWAWMGGEINYKSASYGIKGVADTANRPGVREGAAKWKDASGNFWLFGGAGAAENTSGNLNDLWKFNPVTKLWTWIGGDSVSNQKAVYGTRGIASPNNKPGAFAHAVSWTDAAGNFWMYANVLWKYNPAVSQWAWINGDTALTKSVYGIKGVAHIANKPGTQNSVEWTDASGNFWLYGNVLWKYNPPTDLWTWVHGDTINTITVYGLKGVPNSNNTPGTRTEVTGWTDAAGKFWLFGGSGTVSTPYKHGFRSFYSGDINDLWKYDPGTNLWTWISGDTLLYAQNATGTIGTAAPGNRPGARSDAVSWTDSSGHFWLFGGYTYTSFSLPNSNPYNDLWKYNTSTNLWTCLKNKAFSITQDSFSVKGIESPHTKPASRYNAAVWQDAQGSIWIFGGRTVDPEQGIQGYSLNDLLRYNPATNLWALERENKNGRESGIYGTKGVADAANMPGGRYDAASLTDLAGNVWLFGGHGFNNWGRYWDDLNDFWKRDTANRWTWVSGLNTTTPPARSNAIIWTDANNQLWLFGGTKVAFTFYNDLWNFNKITNQWNPVSANSAGYYGTKGLPAAANKPPARGNAISWSNDAGKLWLFGGNGNNFINPPNELNDLWSFDPVTNQWTWISGDSTWGQSGVYGNIRVSNSANKPGARHGAVSWHDASGNMWLFGGSKNRNNDFFNDLWKYSTLTNTWTWMSGDSAVNKNGMYGTLGIPGAANTPGSRYDAVSWTDATGNLWLFGGISVGISGSESFLNDLWRYDPVSSTWTWMSGDSTINKNGVAGSMGMLSPGNKPGARSGSVTWKDKAGNFWLMGGRGYGTKGGGYLNDLWKFVPTAPALPVKFNSFTASLQNNTALLNWQTTAEQHCANYTIQRSRDSLVFDSIGIVRASCNGDTVNNYTFIDNSPFGGVNHYRIRVIDKDGSSIYTPVRKVTVIPVTGFSVAIWPNPVTTELRLHIRSDEPVQLQLVVRDAAAHLLIRRSLQISSGIITHVVPVNQLASGVYFLTVKSGKTVLTKKFFKH